MRKRLLEQWNSYRREVIRADANSNQLIESRRAFYAGARALYTLQMTQLEDGHDATDADLRMMEEIAKELHQFVEDVKAGVA